MITSLTRRLAEPTQVFIDIATVEGKKSGLRLNSVVNCVNLFTVEQTKVLRILGTLPASLMQQIDHCLKVSLGLP